MGRSRSYVTHDPIWRVPAEATPARPAVLARWRRRHTPLNARELASIANYLDGYRHQPPARLPPRCTA